jgi:ferredoxin
MAKELDRRTLLKGFTFSALGFGSLVAFGDVLESFVLPNGQKIALAKAAIFADKALCSGCRTCEMVCANFNSGGRNSSSLARISVEKEYVKGDYQPKVCYQCADPPCLKACPVGALRVDSLKGTYARIIEMKRHASAVRDVSRHASNISVLLGRGSMSKSRRRSNVTFASENLSALNFALLAF